MDNMDKLDIVGEVLEEKRRAEDVLNSWNNTELSETYMEGFLMDKSSSLEQAEAYEMANKHFSINSISEEPQGLEKDSLVPLYSETVFLPSDYVKWYSFGFPIINWEIKTNKAKRKVTFHSDGKISLWKRGKSWPRKKDALVLYEGNYKVNEPDLNMMFVKNKEDKVVAPEKTEISFQNSILTFKNGEFSIARDTNTGNISIKFMIVDLTKRKTLEAKFISNGEVLHSGFLRVFSFDENNEVTNSIRIVSDEIGRRTIKATPVIGRPKEFVLFERTESAIKELAPESYREFLLDYIAKIKDSKNPTLLYLDGISKLENEAIELLGKVRGELLLDGLTTRVDNLIKVWKKEIGIDESKVIKMK